MGLWKPFLLEHVFGCKNSVTKWITTLFQLGQQQITGSVILDRGIFNQRNFFQVQKYKQQLWMTDNVCLKGCLFQEQMVSQNCVKLDDSWGSYKFKSERGYWEDKTLCWHSETLLWQALVDGQIWQCPQVRKSQKKNWLHKEVKKCNVPFNEKCSRAHNDHLSFLCQS